MYYDLSGVPSKVAGICVITITELRTWREELLPWIWSVEEMDHHPFWLIWYSEDQVLNISWKIHLFSSHYLLNECRCNTWKQNKTRFLPIPLQVTILNHPHLLFHHHPLIFSPRCIILWQVFSIQLRHPVSTALVSVSIFSAVFCLSSFSGTCSWFAQLFIFKGLKSSYNVIQVNTSIWSI